MKRRCVICHKPFETKASRRSMCYNNHYHPCPVCGQPTLSKDLHHLHNCCCKEHSRILAGRGNSEFWANLSEEHRQDISNKRKIKCLEKYGVDNASKSPEVKAKINQSCVEFRKSDAYQEMLDQRKQTNLERYGVDHPMKSDEVKMRMLRTIHEKYGDDVASTLQVDEVKKKCNKTNMEKFGVNNPMQNHDVWSKQTSRRSKTIASDGMKLDSEYERYIYEFCINNNILIERSIPIDYIYHDQEHRTFIDFKIDDMLFEGKGEHILNGYFDNRSIPIAAKLDVYSQHHVIVVTGKSCAEMFDDKLIGLDIDIFRNSDVFEDGLKLWKLISYQCQYAASFISFDNILNLYTLN